MYRYNASNFQPTMRQDSNGNRGMAIEEKIQSPFSKQQQVKVQFSYIWSLNPSWKLNHDSNPNINRALILLARASNHSLDNAKAMQCQKKMSYAMQCYSTSNSRGISFPWGNDKGASIPGFAACTCLITSLQSLGDASDREKRGVTSACQSTSNTADPAPCHGGPADETVCERQRIPISWRSIQQSGMGEKPPSQSIPSSSFHSQTTILREPEFLYDSGNRRWPLIPAIACFRSTKRQQSTSDWGSFPKPWTPNPNDLEWQSFASFVRVPYTLYNHWSAEKKFPLGNQQVFTNGNAPHGTFLWEFILCIQQRGGGGVVTLLFLTVLKKAWRLFDKVICCYALVQRVGTAWPILVLCHYNI